LVEKKARSKAARCSIMNLPTVLSLLRGFFALAFFSSSSPLRLSAIVGAALLDFLDGYFARKWNQISKLGTMLDPLMDKLFVGVALGVFYKEGLLSFFEIALFLLRDISLILFFFVLAATNSMKAWNTRSFFCGKVHTTVQFVALCWLAFGVYPPSYLYWAMGVFGSASFFELLRLRTRVLDKLSV
jgi:CDP-diacylglycerol--glycerol-3-phosphate 3-phosphatidyltransferase